MILRRACLLLVTALLSTGCAERLSLLEKPNGGEPLSFFWPPPQATSITSTDIARDPSRALSFGEVAQRISGALESAGYRDRRFRPVGVHYLHGFAVMTRLEAFHEEDATPEQAAQRWSPRFPEAPTLRWLDDIREMRLPGEGRYRIFLVAFTDLPVRHEEGHAPRWNEATVMESPRMVPMAFPAERPVPEGYRVGVYVYEYESTSADGEGAFVASDVRIPAATHVERSGLSKDDFLHLGSSAAR